jgi:deoxyribonucleoside regulator
MMCANAHQMCICTVPQDLVMDESTLELLAQVGSMYYEQDMTQHQIGAALGLSRVKVYRLLNQARAEGVVQVKVNWPIARDDGLEGALRRQFGLNEALVLKTASHSTTPVLQRLGQLCARYLERILGDGMTIALCLGSSTYEVINAISPDFHARVRVAQATGSMPFAVRDFESATVAHQFAHKLGGEVLYLSSPLIADSVEAADVMRRQSEIRRTLKAAGQAHVALLGIGNLDPATSGFVRAGFLTPEVLAALSADGAVGDMAGQIFTQAGELHACHFNQRVIGITFDDLRRIPITVAVASGLAKGRAILGALRTGTINVLTTDDRTAREVLRLSEAQG